MSTKAVMTRTEAIEFVRSKVFGITNTGQAAKWVDFFIAAGMLEVKEEENHIENAILDAMRNAGNTKELLHLLNIKGYKIVEK